MDIVEQLRDLEPDLSQDGYDDSAKAMLAAADEIERLRAALTIPDGWQVVPKVPTEEMLLAGMGDDWPEDLYLRDVYELMIEAAPKTPND